MGLIILIVAVVLVYYIIGISKDKDAESQRKQDPLNSKSLENYTNKRNLFLLYKVYLYDNIIYFKSISNYNIIKDKIEQDFPRYGDGLYGSGIMRDFSKYDLFDEDYNGKIQLGKTFQIISIAYENFKEFSKEIYNSDYKMRYSVGGYHSDFGDDITSKIFYIELQNAKFYFGLSSGGSKLRDYEKRHNIKSEDGEMYLFTELQVNKNSNYTYPHFEIINLRKDFSIREYHDYFNKNLNISKNLLNI
jgi:hypothetical protein